MSSHQENATNETIFVDLTFALAKAGGCMAITYAVADQVCQRALGTSLTSIMPQIDGDGGATATTLAVMVGTYAAAATSRSIHRASRAVSNLIGGPRQDRQLPNEATARLDNGIWLVSGFRADEVVAMDQRGFAKFEKELASAGKYLTKIIPTTISAGMPSITLADTVSATTTSIIPTFTTMHYRGGKLHSDYGPAVVVTDRETGEVMKETWCQDGRKVPPSVVKERMCPGDAFADDGVCDVAL